MVWAFGHDGRSAPIPFGLNSTAGRQHAEPHHQDAQYGSAPSLQQPLLWHRPHQTAAHRLAENSYSGFQVWKGNPADRTIIPRRSSRKRAVMILSSQQDNSLIYPLPVAERWRSSAPCGELNIRYPPQKIKKKRPSCKANLEMSAFYQDRNVRL